MAISPVYNLSIRDSLAHQSTPKAPKELEEKAAAVASAVLGGAAAAIQPNPQQMEKDYEDLLVNAVLERFMNFNNNEAYESKKHKLREEFKDNISQDKKVEIFRNVLIPMIVCAFKKSKDEEGMGDTYFNRLYFFEKEIGYVGSMLRIFRDIDGELFNNSYICGTVGRDLAAIFLAASTDKTEYLHLLETYKSYILPTITSLEQREIYKNLPAICIPVAGANFHEKSFPDLIGISPAFFTEEALESVKIFFEKTKPTGVVEPHCGSGFFGMILKALGQQMGNKDFSYSGYRFESSLQKVRYHYFSRTNGLIEAYHPGDDLGFMKKAATASRTVLHCTPNFEGALESLKVYVNACQGVGITPTLMIISPQQIAYDESYRNFLVENFKEFGKRVTLKPCANTVPPVLSFYVGRVDLAIK